MPAIDREVGNWRVIARPSSRFCRNFVVTMAGSDGKRMSVLNHEFTRRRGAEELERFEFSDTGTLLGVHGEWFGIRLPSDRIFAIA